MAREAYRSAQQAVREEVEREVYARDRRALTEILSAPRGERGKKFWKHVNRAKPKEKKATKIKNSEGEPVTESTLQKHLTSVAEEILEATESKESTRLDLCLTMTSAITTDSEEIKNILSRVKTSSSCGLDKIPANVLKELSEYSLEYIADLFNKILEGELSVPQEWLMNRVTMIEKSNSIRGRSSDHGIIDSLSHFRQDPG